MARRKKRKSRHPDKTGDGESRPVDTNSKHVVSESNANVSAQSNGVACLLLLLSAAIVVCVFVPWFGRYFEGQFFGLTGDYGTDFFRYSQGSTVLVRPSIDPYSNEQMYRALEEGHLGTDHPNPNYDMQTSIKSFAETPEPIAKGVVSPPFLLVLIAPLIRVCGYTLALNVWTVASLLGISWLCVQFWRKLIPPGPRWQQFASHGAMLSLLVLSSFPVLWSAIYGQFEAIYFMAIGGAIYCWNFKRDSPTTPLVVGLLLAIGGAVKLFPLLLLGYFLWQAIRAYRHPSVPTSGRSLMGTPEAKVILFGIVGFMAINTLTGLVFGFDLYSAFLNKIADLQVEGTGPSMKGNLLSFLNFVPVWLLGPFTRMHQGTWIAYALIVVGIVVAIVRSIRSKVTLEPLTHNDQMKGLLEMTLILAALPTLLPHWWIYYNVILILPLMVCFVAAKDTIDRRAGRWIMTLTALSFVLTFSYLTTSVFFGAFPHVYDVIINRAAVDAALAQASANPALMENLPYSRAFGEPYVAEFEGRVISLFNLVYGYPGTVLLFAANWLALRSPRHVRDNNTYQPSSISWWLTASTVRVKLPVTLAAGALLSLAGGYAIVWEGTRRLAQVPHVEFVTDDHGVEDANRYVDQLLERFRETASRQPQVETTGLVLDLLPPNHFIETVAQSDHMLAKALLEQDHRYFENQASVDKLRALFERYQTNLSAQYPSWFESVNTATLPAWRHHGQPGGLLMVLERKCHRQSIPLRRPLRRRDQEWKDQEWMQWQWQFLYESAWQRSLESLGRGDFAGFVKYIFEHRGALSQHQAVLNKRVAELRRSLSHSTSDSDKGRVGFVFMQTPVYTKLSAYPACRDLDENASLETGVHIGTRYVVEEVLRRARIAKNGTTHEALMFAKKTVSQIEDPQIVAWWTQETTIGPSEILRSLSQGNLIDIDQIEAEGLLIWSQLLEDQDQRKP